MNSFKSKLIIITLFLVAIIVGVYFVARRPTRKSEIPYGEQQGLQRPEDSVFRPQDRGDRPQGNSTGDCLSDGCLAINDLEYPVSELPAPVINALNKAIDDEYKAYSTYDAIINKFGRVRPFIMIIRAEEQHIISLKSIYDKYGVEIPENSYLGTIPAPDSVSGACATGVLAEIDNAALYKEELLPVVEEYDDITSVFTSLMNASQEKHLPAFQKCSN